MRIKDLQRRETEKGRTFWMARIQVAKSRGRQLGVPVRDLAATALSAWLDWLRAQGVERGAVFRRFKSNGQPGTGLNRGSFYQILVDRCGAPGEAYRGLCWSRGGPQ